MPEPVEKPSPAVTMMCVMCSKCERELYCAYLHTYTEEVGDGESDPEEGRQFKVFQLLDCVSVFSTQPVTALLYIF